MAQTDIIEALHNLGVPSKAHDIYLELRKWTNICKSTMKTDLSRAIDQNIVTKHVIKDPHHVLYSLNEESKDIRYVTRPDHLKSERPRVIKSE